MRLGGDSRAVHCSTTWRTDRGARRNAFDAGRVGARGPMDTRALLGQDHTRLVRVGARGYRAGDAAGRRGGSRDVDSADTFAQGTAESGSGFGDRVLRQLDIV